MYDSRRVAAALEAWAAEIRTPTSLRRLASTVIVSGLAAFAAAAAWAHTRRPRTVRRAFQAWGGGEGSIYDLMDANTEIVIPGTAVHCGAYRKDAFLRDVAGPFGARFAKPPLPQLRALWSKAGIVAALADATGTTRDGQPYTNAYVFVFEMAGRRVTRVTEFLDMAAFNAVWDRVAPAPAHAG